MQCIFTPHRRKFTHTFPTGSRMVQWLHPKADSRAGPELRAPSSPPLPLGLLQRDLCTGKEREGGRERERERERERKRGREVGMERHRQREVGVN